MKLKRKYTCLLLPVLGLALLFLSLICLNLIYRSGLWCQSILAEGKSLSREYHYTEALTQYQAALNCYRSIDDQRMQGVILANRGLIYDRLGRYDEALITYQQALTISRVVGDRAGEGTDLNNIGHVYGNQGRYQEALDTYQQALIIRREVSDRDGEGSTLSNIGAIYVQQSRNDEALEAFQQALAIRHEVGDRAGEGITLNNIGNVYDNQGRYQEAQEAYQKALVINQEVSDRVTEGTTLNNIGHIYHAQGRYDEALKAYQQALVIRREVSDRAGEGVTLNNIGEVYRNQGRYNEALNYYQQALSIIREVGDRAEEGTILSNIGNVYGNQGRFNQAMAYYQQALAIKREVGDRAGEGRTLTGIGSVYNYQGHFEEARQAYQQALTISREVGDRAAEGAILNNMGLVYHHQGRYTEALGYYQQALAIIRKVGDLASESGTLSNIGGVYSEQGRYEEAQQVFQQALSISREVGNRAWEGIILHNLGEVYRSQGRYEAQETLQQALTIIQEVGDRAEEGRTLVSIGGVYHEQGNYDEALTIYQQALAIIREVGDRASESRILNNIGGLYTEQGRYNDALNYLQQSLAIIREVGERSWEGLTLANIGAVYDGQEGYADAMTAYQQAMDIFEAVRAMAGSEQGRAVFIAQYANLYNRAVALYHRQGQDEEAFLAAERGRARTFLDGLATGQVQLSDNAAADLLAQEQETYAQCQAIRDALAKAKALNPPDPVQVTNLEQEMARSEQAYAQVQADIQARGDQLADLVPGRNKSVLDVAQVQALLDEQITLLAYYLLDDKTLAFLLTADDFQVVELPISRAELTNSVTDFRKFTDDQAGETTRRRAEKLYQMLIAPLSRSLTTPHLVIVPHQILHYLPFAALYNAQAGKYLVEKYTLSTLPSASVLQFVATTKQQAVAAPQNIAPALVLAYPKVEQEPNPTIVVPDFPTLRFADDEAEAIAALYGVEPLLGKTATEAALQQQVAGAGILHLAAHGYYNSDTPLNSLIALAPGDDYDGWLTAGEVYGLNLKQTNLVVLSACQTQLGELKKDQEDRIQLNVTSGDDVVNLTRAFMFAGTPTVVATLWNVDDEATPQLMERFYTHLQAGLGKAEALRQAQLALLKEPATADPFFWAAFVLSGDGGQ